MRFPRALVAVALAAVVSLSVVGCSGDNVAATVNGEKITKAELQAQLDLAKKTYPQYFQGSDAASRTAEIERGLLDELINRKLVAQAAKEQGVSATDADIQKQVDQLKANFKSQAEFEKAMKNAGMEPSSLKDQLRFQMLTLKLVEKSNPNGLAPTPAEIEKYYADYKSEFTQAAAMRASHILVKDEATAKKILSELKGGADFASVAKASSIDTASAQNGGDLGWPATPYVPEFQAALDKLKVGQQSGVVKSQFGYHIIKATEKREARRLSLDEARAQITKKLEEQKKIEAYQGLLENLRKKAKIETFVKAPAPSGS